MKINVIGLGYIGLPTSAVFADYGVEVLGVDVSKHVVDTVNAGKIHIEEPGLADLIKKGVTNKMLRASTKPEKADAFIIAVPTPSKNDEFNSCDLKYVVSAVNNIISVLEKGNVVIIESTMEPRATEDVVLPLFEKAGFEVGIDIFLAHCPERVLPGKILHEVIYNDRIIGGITEKCTEKAAEVYEVFVKGELIKTEAKTAELSKLMENTFRDVNIALANELAKISNSLDINALDVIEMANKHPRVNIHTPGPGVGGHCLAIDPYFIHSNAPEHAKIIKLARDTNVSMPDYVVNSVMAITKDTDKVITALGVAYKPDVDDVRESPGLIIIEKLKEKGYKVKIHDPFVNDAAYFSLEDSLKDSDLVLCLTGHTTFKSITTKDLVEMNNKVFFDTTNSISSIEGIKFYNYGNLYEVKKKGAVTK